MISKNIRHTPNITEFLDEYVQVGKDGRKLMSKTFFKNTKNTENSGFITFLYVVNGLQPVGGNGGQEKTFSQTEFVFIQDDVDFIQVLIEKQCR